MQSDPSETYTADLLVALLLVHVRGQFLTALSSSQYDKHDKVIWCILNAFTQFSFNVLSARQTRCSRLVTHKQRPNWHYRINTTLCTQNELFLQNSEDRLAELGMHSMHSKEIELDKLIYKLEPTSDFLPDESMYGCMNQIYAEVYRVHSGFF